jgi:transcriptional regulator GlxA family with amidase domain
MSPPNTHPLKYGIVLFAGFQALDAMGPIDFLSFLDFPDVPHHPPGTSLIWLAESLSPVSSKSPTHQARLNPAVAVSVNPNATYASFLASEEELDVLIIPGGIGTREPADGIISTREFIGQIAPRITTAIITVCTGSDLLATTGLLDKQSVRATTNMTRFDMVSGKSDVANREIEWLRKVRWVKSSITSPRELEIWTSAGVSAGMDVMLAFIAEKYGHETAVKLARMSEVDWKELESGQIDPMYDGWD